MSISAKLGECYTKILILWKHYTLNINLLQTYLKTVGDFEKGNS